MGVKRSDVALNVPKRAAAAKQVQGSVVFGPASGFGRVRTGPVGVKRSDVALNVPKRAAAAKQVQQAGCWSSAGPLASRIPVFSVLRFHFREYALLVSLFLRGSQILLFDSIAFILKTRLSRSDSVPLGAHIRCLDRLRQYAPCVINLVTHIVPVLASAALISGFSIHPEQGLRQSEPPLGQSQVCPSLHEPVQSSVKSNLMCTSQP